MSISDNNPKNQNPLSPIKFRFSLKRAPTVVYFVQSVGLPGVVLGEAPVENVFLKTPTPGDKLTFEPLNLRFQVDENMADYLEIFNWLQGLGFPDNFGQSIHPSIRNNVHSERFTGSGATCDGTLVILTSHDNPNVRVTFQEMFPISLSTLQFDLTQSEITYLEADVTFAYHQFSVDLI